MEIGAIIFVIVISVVGIWLLSRLNIVKHKLFLILIIVFILLAFFSFTGAFSGQDLSLKGPSDFMRLAKIYFSWFGNAFDNLKTLTAQAINMDWQTNKTS